MITERGDIWIATSSGGPWLKESGRVGSSAIKGAGFDLHKSESGEAVACVATGHGENIIETMAS